MRALHATLIAVPLALCGLAPAANAAESTTSHALSLFGDVKYPPDFKHFDYVNPDAPKGGTARFAAVGSYDNLNQFIIKGVPAAGVGGVFDTLMTQSLDEPATEYGLLAESVEVAQDRSWVIYTLRKEARFNDGSPVTPDDVIWTFETLRSKGRPQYRGYYADVGGVEPQEQRQSRAAADHRRAAGAPEGMVVDTRFRQDDARAAARQRPLQGRSRRSRPLDHLSPRRRLLGRQSAGQSRAQQFRRHALRLLSRPDRLARSLQGRAIRFPHGEFVEGLGDRL